MPLRYDLRYSRVLILDLGQARLSVPRECRQIWMASHPTPRPANHFWCHQSVKARFEGSLRARHYPHHWRIEGRGGLVTYDPVRQFLHTYCPEGFWLPRALRLVDVMSRVLERQLACHASAVKKRSKLWLFAGLSGAGKSTAAQLAQSQGWELLQDDLVFLNQGHYLSKIDWSDPQKQSTAFNKKITGVILLEKASRHELIPLSITKACQRLMPVWGPLVGQNRTHWLEDFHREISCLPVYLLRFKKDAGFIELLKKAV